MCMYMDVMKHYVAYLYKYVYTCVYPRCIHAYVNVGNAEGARRVLVVGLCFAVTWLVLVEAFTLSLIDYIPTIFTTNQDLLKLMPLPMLALVTSLLADQLQSFLAGVLRGAGRQTIGAVSNFGSYWLFGVPLGVILATVGDMGALGYWIGLVGATFAQLALYVVVVFWCTRWEDQAVKIHEASSLASSVGATSRAASTACQHPGKRLSVIGNWCS